MFKRAPATVPVQELSCAVRTLSVEKISFEERIDYPSAPPLFLLPSGGRRRAHFLSYAEMQISSESDSEFVLDATGSI